VSLGKRAYDLLRAYVGQQLERIESVFERDARSELDDYLNPETRPVQEVPKPAPAPEQNMTAATAARILNLGANATLEDLHREYKRLSERSLPANFPEGSEERKKAAIVHLRVQEAYEILLPVMDSRLRRFQNLDLD